MAAWWWVRGAQLSLPPSDVFGSSGAVLGMPLPPFFILQEWQIVLEGFQMECGLSKSAAFLLSLI